MKICPTHWSQLRSAITERGIRSLVSKSILDLVGRLRAGEFDPLFFANNEIMSDYMRTGAGEGGLGECPVCAFDEADQKSAIDKAADCAFQEAVRLGLVKTH